MGNSVGRQDKSLSIAKLEHGWQETESKPRVVNDDDIHWVDGFNQVFSFQQNMFFDMSIPKQLYDNSDHVPEITMMAWIKPTKGGDLRIFDSCVAGEGFGGFGFDIYCNKIRFLGSREDSLSTQLCGFSSKSNIELYAWNHCCFTFKNGILNIYLNGKLDNTAKSTLKKMYKPVMDRLCIGYAMRGHPNSGYYRGFMSHLSIWNIELDQNQVEFCMKNSLLNLDNSKDEFHKTFSNHCLVYLPYMDIQDQILTNFGIDNSLKIKTNEYHELSVESMEESNFDQLGFPICEKIIWSIEKHPIFPKQKKKIIELLLMIMNRMQEDNFLYSLPLEVVEYIFSYL